MNIISPKPPISQKCSPVTIKYNQILSTKPMYYSPKIKSTNETTLITLQNAGTNNNNFTSCFDNFNNKTYENPQHTSKSAHSNPKKSLKKSESNHYINTSSNNYFDFSMHKTSDISSSGKKFDNNFVNSLKNLRKENKITKSEGDISCNYDNNQKITISGINYSRNLVKDSCNNPAFLGLEPTPTKSLNLDQTTILDKSLPKFLRNLNIKNNNALQNFTKIKANEITMKKTQPTQQIFHNEPQKFELKESFASLISNDSDLQVKKIKNIEFSANPFANNANNNYSNPSNFYNNISSMHTTFVKKNWKIEDFDLGKCLGKGRFGKVFIAREKKTKCLFALKCILKKGIDGQGLEQMIREIKIQSFLKHVNIVNLYGCFEDSVKIYLILELAFQGNLYDLLKKQTNQRFDESCVAGYLKQVLEAIKYLHSNYIIHRDIKPENILVSHGILKLADFGWSIYAPEDKRTTFCGTVDYVAPEIVAGSLYDAKVDLWSLGVLCFELTTGKAPFEHRINREAFKKIMSLNYKCPEFLSEICKDFINKLLVKDPKMRYDIAEISNHAFLSKAPVFTVDGFSKKIKEFKENF